VAFEVCVGINRVTPVVATALVTLALLGVRDRAMLELFYSSGLRVSELVHLRLADVHLDDFYLSTMGKGRKQRLVPIGAPACQAVARYLQRPPPGVASVPSSEPSHNWPACGMTPESTA